MRLVAFLEPQTAWHQSGFRTIDECLVTHRKTTDGSEVCAEPCGLLNRGPEDV